MEIITGTVCEEIVKLRTETKDVVIYLYRNQLKGVEMENVKVLFRKNDGEVYAFFPEATANYGMVMTYAHIGQHGEASLEFYWNSEKATEKEYADLLSELKSVYNDCALVVRQRMNYNDLRASWNRR